MTLGELLKQHLRDPLTQKSVAMSWHGQAQASGQSWSPSTIESHLSRCLRDQQQGVRFFFEVRERARMLLDIMNVPESDRAPIYAAAEEMLKMDKARPPRLLIDITASSGWIESRPLFEALRAAIVEPRPLEPTLLLLTAAQFDDLPRSFDQHEEWLRVEMVTAAEAAARLEDPALAGTLVASFRRYSPPERWLAMSFDPSAGRLLFEPADGLERFARDGALPLPVVVHELSRFVGDGPLPAIDPSALGPLEQRRAMVDLALEDRAEQVAQSPVMRLAMARALGVVATATQRDRVEAELRDAAAVMGAKDIASLSQAEFEELMVRARRRLQSQTIARVGDFIEIVNPGKDQPGLAHPRVRVHHIEAAIPAIARLRAAVSRWTLGDFEADPFLERLIQRLDPEGREHRAFLHARAVLLHRSLSPQPGRVVDDWRSTLERLLARDVPPATLRFSDLRRNPSEGYVTIAAPPWVETALRDVPERDASVLMNPRPALADAVTIARDRMPAVAKEEAPGYSHRDETGLRIPQDEGSPAGDADEQWLQSFEDWGTDRRPWGAKFFRPVTSKPMESLPWAEADRQLGLIWLALRGGIRSAPAVRLHDGRALFPVSDGLVAQVDVRETAERVAPQALLDISYSSLVVGVASGVSSVTLAIPRRVVLHGEQLRAEVEFLGSPLFSGANARAAIRAAELDRQEEEERAARERDDDD